MGKLTIMIPVMTVCRYNVANGRVELIPEVMETLILLPYQTLVDSMRLRSESLSRNTNSRNVKLTGKLIYIPGNYR